MLPLFKPNKSKTGNLVDFGIQSSRKEKNKAGLYLKITKQCGPMSAPFAGSKEKATIKLNELELSCMLNAIERRGNWSTVHKVGDNAGRSITFNTLYKKDEAGEPTKDVSGFAFNTSLSGQKFGFTLSLGESVLIREFFKYAISHLLDGRYSEEKTRIKALKSAPEEAPTEEEVEEELQD